MSERGPDFNPAWSELLETALTLPGNLGNTYNRFTSYSFGNQIALAMQGVTSPVAGYKKWPEFNRYVKRGAKGKWIQHPVIRQIENEEGERVPTVTGFTWRKSVFELNDTEGEDLPPWDPPEWSRERALGALGIQLIDFASLDGNTAGYSHGNEVAINPVARYPFKTLIHEIGHVVLGHTSAAGLEEYRTHRGLMEFGAEGTAYLVLNELDALDQMNASESRGYIQHWIRKQRPDDKSIRQVFTATDKILQAGRNVNIDLAEAQ